MFRVGLLTQCNGQSWNRLDGHIYDLLSISIAKAISITITITIAMHITITITITESCMCYRLCVVNKVSLPYISVTLDNRTKKELSD